MGGLLVGVVAVALLVQHGNTLASSVVTKQGTVVGWSAGGFDVYRGVPYVSPVQLH
jgi:hypothetical protein